MRTSPPLDPARPHSKLPTRPRAFTLIELLIVVAIIAILAAIAIPNLLEAQVRAKVSRARNDLRVIATGLEAFHVDNNRYPYGIIEMTPGLLTSVPRDVFARDPESTTNYYYLDLLGYPVDSTAYGQAAAISGGWILASVGPDGNFSNTPPDTMANYNGIFRDYDPTNGTISLGNIFRTRTNPQQLGTYPVFYQ